MGSHASFPGGVFGYSPHTDEPDGYRERGRSGTATHPRTARKRRAMPIHAQDALEHERVELDEAFHVERHNSIEPVPESRRGAKPLHQFWIWGGANIAPINWVLGALGIVLGLGFWDTVLALALGNLL